MSYRWPDFFFFAFIKKKLCLRFLGDICTLGVSQNIVRTVMFFFGGGGDTDTVMALHYSL